MTKTQTIKTADTTADVKVTDQLSASDTVVNKDATATPSLDNIAVDENPVAAPLPEANSSTSVKVSKRTTRTIKPIKALPIQELKLVGSKSKRSRTSSTPPKAQVVSKTVTAHKRVHIGHDIDNAEHAHHTHHIKHKPATVHGLARHYIDHIGAKAYKDYHVSRELRHDPKTADRKYDGQYIKLAKKVVAELPAIAYYHPKDYYDVGSKSTVDRYVRYLNEIFGHGSWVASPMLTHNLGAVREHYNLLPLTKDAYAMHSAIQHWIEDLLNLESFYDTGHGLVYTAHAHYHTGESIPSHINITVEPGFFLENKNHKEDKLSSNWHNQIATRFETAVEKLRHVVGAEAIDKCHATFDKKTGKFTCKIPNFNLNEHK